ncbi:MAG: hypothetical protein ACFE94_12770 [Candidatus Hodarchaeota archaeon]
MNNNIVEFPPEFEEMINKLEEQITALFSEIHYYQALVTEKENTIIRLTTENRYLKAKIQELPGEITPPPLPPRQKSSPSYPDQESYTPPPPPPQQEHPASYPSQESYTPPAADQYRTPNSAIGEDTRINKRVCPRCGAMGFAIKEINDKSRVISYSPQKIYAKKKSCTKCRYEWSSN